MKKTYIKLLLFLCIIFCQSSFAQRPASVLWEITGNQVPKKSYLFGACHTVSYEILDHFTALKNIISSCDYGLFEKSERNIGEVPQVEIYTPPLDSVFSKTEYALVDSFFTQSSFGSIVPHNNDESLSGILQAVLMLNENKARKPDMFFDDYIQFYMDSCIRKALC